MVLFLDLGSHLYKALLWFAVKFFIIFLSTSHVTTRLRCRNFVSKFNLKTTIILDIKGLHTAAAL
ncbi:hypothetical protein BAZSYMB_SCAFFOLD00049_7 [Bathymodiolus azoricus thioautotrophic gill symbiont]|uniref:Uncharacterized protein n=1 Tax=Bathymodiolus azoricus thioautotrophic gill symbiont TaxID=235205 RepID=A0A1H6K3U3_9GAMM|nr:hypothetical protein BAZSYMB_SCAFFOLD00049_7 [Bathymodiolus azoricus thioautotrophic gill symbiont]